MIRTLIKYLFKAEPDLRYSLKLTEHKIVQDSVGTVIVPFVCSADFLFEIVIDEFKFKPTYFKVESKHYIIGLPIVANNDMTLYVVDSNLDDTVAKFVYKAGDLIDYKAINEILTA